MLSSRFYFFQGWQYITKHSAIIYKQPKVVCVMAHSPQFRFAKLTGGLKGVEAVRRL